MKTDSFVRGCALAIVFLLALLVFRPMQPVKAAGSVEWEVVSLPDLQSKDSTVGLTRDLFRRMSREGWEYVGDTHSAYVGNPNSGTLLIFKK
jgi:hypothetical protein